jgi:hypothetical protein
MTISRQNMVNLEMLKILHPEQPIEYQVQIAPELVAAISRHLDEHPTESWDGLLGKALAQYLEVLA